MQKSVIKAADYGKGKKRVNISLGIEDYESLVELAGEKGIVVPGTYALSLLTQAIREEKKKMKPKELPGQQHLSTGKNDEEKIKMQQARKQEMAAARSLRRLRKNI